MTQTTTDPSLSHLERFHREELLTESAIDPDVVLERGYTTVHRPEAGSTAIHGVRAVGTTREILSRMGFPSWAIRENYFYPGMWIPQYSPTGERYAGQWKPKSPVANRDGKRMKYASAKGASRLDVHPRWSADRGKVDSSLLPAIKDPSLRLWITEGVKKADSLTSRGEVTVALAGVFNWRNQHGALGDWEEVRLKGREVVVCFDADTISKPSVARAMDRLGKWLKFRGASKVWYLVVPPGVNGKATKGVDDFFAAGGTLKELEQAFETKPPSVTDTDDRFTDAQLAQTLAEEVLDGAYVWAAGLDWLAWDGRVWAEASEVSVLEAVRVWARDHFADAAAKLRLDDKSAGGEVEGWKAMLSASRSRAVLTMAKGIVERRADAFDSDPDILNTPSGIVDLTTGEVHPHDPDMLCTKITSGAYRPGFTHPDWDRALTVLPQEETVRWLQTRFGQAITGHTTPDGIVPILKGGGENGKSLLTTDGLMPALGGYASAASPKLFEKGGHSTERADLRGRRLVVAEELTEGQSIDVTSLKRVADVGRVNARFVHKNNVEFDSSHSLFITTNPTPQIHETDHGTWRRLCLVVFPFRFMKPGEPIENPEFERRGDPTLKARIKANKGGQHDAAVTWAVEGAVRWYANANAIESAVAAGEEPPPSALLLPPTVAADTLSWRKQSDRILGFWEDCLVTEPGAVILASEMTDRFNEWLRDGGHRPWSKETFRPRFEEHGETKARRAQFKRKAYASTVADRVVRAPGWGVVRDLPARIDVWINVRWRTAADTS